MAIFGHHFLGKMAVFGGKVEKVKTKGNVMEECPELSKVTLKLS